PLSVIVFGSLARREAVRDSDIDLVVVRPAEIDEDDEVWASSLERWRGDIRRMTGNRVEVLEADPVDVLRQLSGGGGLWETIRNEGRVVHGLDLDQLASTLDA